MMHVQVSKTLRSGTRDMHLEVKLAVEKGQFVVIQGKSGAGKTSLLRMVAGLMAPDKGFIRIQDTSWFDSEKRINTRPQDRNIGYVFQEYALFPNMSVKENLVFAQKETNTDQINSVVDMMGLGNLLSHKPDTLSGGQQQRVALARTLMRNPRILLLDEPLSALDHSMRLQLQQYLIEVHREFELTTLMVSHDVSEAVRLADSVVVLDEGKVVTKGSPDSMFGDSSVSGKFQFTGTIVSMERQNFLYILSILIGNDVVKVIADEEEVTEYRTGDKVLVASKAFNPIIKKIE